jgi:hypothetical protein
MALSPGASFGGGSGSIRVNGVSNGVQLRIEGQETGNSSATGNQQMVQPSVESLQEVALQTSNYSAEFGQSAGGILNFTAKSGTNSLHGTVYDYLANTHLNAGQPFTNNGNGQLVRNPVHRNDWGFAAGGPVIIPKIYNGRNRTFFFYSLEQFRENLGNHIGGLTVPTAAMRAGDFSGVLGTQIGTDSLGRPILLNMIYDPGTERTVNNQVVRDPFSGNLIPLSRISQVALNIQKYIPLPVNSGNAANWALSWTSPRVATVDTLKLDQELGSRGHIAFYYQFGSVAASRQTGAGGSEGLPDPITAGRDNKQTPRVYRLSYDVPLRPTLLFHLGAGYQSLVFADDMYRSYTDPLSGKVLPVESFDSVTQLGLTGAAALGFPRITGLVTSFGGMQNMGPVSNQIETLEKPSAVASATYVHENHTYKLGGDWRLDSYLNPNITGSQGIYAFSAAQTALPYLQSTTIGGNSLGFPYASFMLGAVNTASLAAPSDFDYRRPSVSLFVQDTWKLARKLTLDYGLRWDWQEPVRELHDRMSEFAPSIANPSAGGLPGAVQFVGFGAGRCNCNFTNAYPYAIGPRVGVAYQITPKTVLRAGWGIFYGNAPAFNTVGNNGFLGVGNNTLSFTNPAFGEQAANLTTGLVYSPASLTALNLNPGIRPDPGQTDSPTVYVDPNGGRPPRIMQTSIGLQRELTRNLVAEASYVGSRSVWTQANGSYTDLNGDSAARFAAFGLDINSATDRALLISPMSSTSVAARGFKIPYAGFPTSATLAQALRPYPQFGTIPVIGAPTGDSWYDSLQSKLTQRYSHGLVASTSFAWQKELSIGEAGAVNDVYNRRVNKSLSPSSQPLTLALSLNYQVPKFKQNWIGKVAANWTIGAVMRYASGLPILAPAANNNLNTLLLRAAGTATYANRVAGQPLFLQDLNCHCFDPNKTLVLNPPAWTDPAAGQFGGTAMYFNDYRYQRRPTEALSAGRIFKVREHLSLEVRVQFQNPFNRVEVADPTATNAALKPTLTNGQYVGGFGYLNTGALAFQPRVGQALARVSW